MDVIQTAKTTWGEAADDNLGLLAAGVAFYAFLAMVPLLAAFVLTYGLVADPALVIEQADSVARTLPPAAAELVIDQMRGLAEGDNATTAIGLLLAIATAIYGATKGAKAVVIALNIVNGVAEPRGFIGQTKAALLITLLLLGTMLAGFATIALAGFVETLLPGSSATVATIFQWLGWLGFAIIAVLSLSLIYRYGPAKARPARRATMTGAVAAAALILAGTLAFALYVANFGSYNATYGALGAVVILQLWLYLSAYALLLGAELATVIDRRLA